MERWLRVRQAERHWLAPSWDGELLTQHEQEHAHDLLTVKPQREERLIIDREMPIFDTDSVPSLATSASTAVSAHQRQEQQTARNAHRSVCSLSQRSRLMSGLECSRIAAVLLPTSNERAFVPVTRGRHVARNSLS